MSKIDEIYEKFMQSGEWLSETQAEDRFRKCMEKYLDGVALKEAEILYQSSLIEYLSNGWHNGFRYAMQLTAESFIK